MSRCQELGTEGVNGYEKAKEVHILTGVVVTLVYALTKIQTPKRVNFSGCELYPNKNNLDIKFMYKFDFVYL